MSLNLHVYISSRGVVYGLFKCRHDVPGKRSIKNDEGPAMGPGHSQDTGTMGGGVDVLVPDMILVMIFFPRNVEDN